MLLKWLRDRARREVDQLLRSQLQSNALNQRILERTQFLSGQIASMGVRQIKQVDNLADVEFRVTSQWGEDGIIEWLCHKLPEIVHSFVEFGVENYTEANTRFLLQNRGWRGLVIDGHPPYITQLRDEPIYWMHDLVAACAFVTAENINDVIAQNGYEGEVGILSVDIDGNDYWVLKAIECIRPALLITEINGVFGDRHAITTPYDPGFRRFDRHPSGQYFGASIRAMIGLAESKGFEFLGTNSSGVNAFFVRNDFADRVIPAIGEIRAWPAHHRDSRDDSGSFTFVRGTAKADLIRKMSVLDLATERTVTLEALFPLYSPAWLEAM